MLERLPRVRRMGGACGSTPPRRSGLGGGLETVVILCEQLAHPLLALLEHNAEGTAFLFRKEREQKLRELRAHLGLSGKRERLFADFGHRLGLVAVSDEIEHE